jgi:hypothetical protein
MRRLCYKHHCEEFDKLPSIGRDKANDWITVKPALCELCGLHHPEWGHSYIIIEGDPGHLEWLLNELSERNYLTEVDFRLICEDPV